MIREGRGAEEDPLKIVRTTLDVDRLMQQATSEVFKNRDTIESFGSLIVKLRERIGTYETLLSDDVGGRLPALVLKEIADTQHPEKPTILRFLRGGQELHLPRVVESVESFIRKNKAGFGKTLVVTELILGGESMQILADILTRQGVDFDVAAIKAKTVPGLNMKGQFFYGGIGAASSIYLKSGLHSGVEKQVGLGAVPPHPTLNRNVSFTAKDDARNDSVILAEEFKRLL